MQCSSCHAENDPNDEACFNCGRSLTALTRGALLAGRYEVLQRLGRGGMGTVYKAHDRTLDEMVAVKVLRPEYANDPEVLRRFRSEIKLARKVRHKNVCGIHDYGEDGPVQFISMQFIDGVTLYQVIREKGALPPRQAFDAAVAVAEGLAAVHEEGIVHRDVKTSNIMRDRKGTIRLMDFGIAKEWTRGAALTATGQALGTPEYMSPEQIRGDKVDFRSDLYALGIVIFELFTGGVPFRGETPAAVLLKHLQGTPPLDEPEARRLPREVKGIVASLLAKDRLRRIGNAHEVAALLRRAQAEGAGGVVVAEAEAVSPPPAAAPKDDVPTVTTPVPVSAAAPTVVAPVRVVRRAPRSSRWLAAGSVAAALGVAALGLWALRNRAETANPHEAVATLAVSSAAVPATVAPTPWATPTSTPPPEPTDSRPAVKPALTKASAKDWKPTATPAEARPAPRAPSTAPPPAADVRSAPTAPPTLAPSPAPTPTPIPTPSLAAPAATPPPAPQLGMLQIGARPWAAVEVDGKGVGTTPMPALSVKTGTHTVRLTNPKYQPVERVVTVRAGETTSLYVELATESKPAKPRRSRRKSCRGGVIGSRIGTFLRPHETSPCFREPLSPCC